MSHCGVHFTVFTQNNSFFLLAITRMVSINVPFIIYSSRRSSTAIAEDLKNGVYGASNSGQELLELVINAIKNG